ncbi:MAG: COX15/CtaA family protein [Pseudolysinimonas sp.]|uniref:COX15/CtaA family protein n=1 Tax=Pseudolysinimonas sp. TaxID=2680009 RepID=UPI003265A8F8
MQTPLGWVADRFTLSPRALRWATTAALVTSILIVLGGGVVRVTGSGLGCPTWPTCDGTSLAPIPELGIHGIIEFANRMFTTVLIIAVGWVIIAARLQKPRDRMITRLAWSQFWLVVANALAGGVTVLAQLNPWTVALHFVLAIALLATATVTWHRVSDRGDRGARTPIRERTLAWALAITTLALVVVGTIVSGAGPHAGDSRDVPRIGVNWTNVVWVHAALAVVVGILAVVVFVSTPRLRRVAGVFVIVFLAQGAIGGIQALTALPELLVALHLVGAALVWVGALRVLLSAIPELLPVDSDG